jgi:hypothetical protein
MLMGAVEIEQACIEQLIRGNTPIVGLDHPRVRIERVDDGAGGLKLSGCRIRDLVEDDDVSEFDLIDQKVNQRPLVSVASSFTAVG